MKQDARITRTLNLIRTAFLDLLEEKGFEAMTVQDILDRTLLNRSTFYKHFTNKNDLAKLFVDELKTLFQHNLEERFSVPTAEFAQRAAPIFWQNKELIRLIGAIETPKINLFRDLQIMLKAQYLRSQQAQQPNANLDFQAHIFAINTIGMLRYFVEKGEKPDPNAVLADVDAVFKLLIIRDEF